MKRRSLYFLVLAICLSLVSIPAGVSASSDKVYKETKEFKGKNLDIEAILPDGGKILKDQLGDKFDKVKWNKVTAVKSYYTLGDNNELAPVTESNIGVLSCGVGEDNCESNYGITIYVTAGDFGSSQEIFGFMFYWDNLPLMQEKVLTG